MMSNYIPLKEPKKIAKPLTEFIKNIIFLFILTILTTDNIYNLLSLILILISLVYVLFYRNDSKLDTNEIYLIFSYFFMFFVPLASRYYHSSDIAEVDNYFRFLLAIPLYLILREIKIDLYSLFVVINISVIIIGIFAIYYFYILDESRVRMYTSTATIVGNISLLFGMLSFVSLKFYQEKSHSLVIPVLAIIFSLIAWDLSGTRGSIIAVFFVLLFLFSERFKNHILLPSKYVTIMSLLLIVIFLSQSNVMQRISTSYNSTLDYIVDGQEHNWKEENSIVPRLIIWDGSINMISRNPISGVGLSNFNKALHLQIISNEIPPVVKANDVSRVTNGMNHAHNQYLDIFAKTGIFGFLALIYFILINLVFFFRELSSRSVGARYSATSGVIIIISYSSYMLTHSIFSHQQSTLFMIYLLIIFSSTINNYKQKRNK